MNDYLHEQHLILKLLKEENVHIDGEYPIDVSEKEFSDDIKEFWKEKCEKIIIPICLLGDGIILWGLTTHYFYFHNFGDPVCVGCSIEELKKFFSNTPVEYIKKIN